MQKNSRKLWIRSAVLLILGFIIFQIPAILVGYPHIADGYSRQVFPVLSYPLVRFSSWIPISLTEWVLYVLLIVVPVAIVVWVVRLVRHPGRGRRLARAVWVIVVLFFVVSVLYTFMHGIHYSGYSVSERLFDGHREQTAEDLEEICAWLAREASALRVDLPEDDEGVMVLSEGLSETLVHGSSAMNAAAVDFPFMAGNNASGKSVWNSHYWSYTGITGMYMPLLGEANVNTDIPASDLPLTICHELAHVRGFAREQDANFLGFLSCLYSDRADFRYSGYLFAFRYCMSDLYRADPERHKAVSAEVDAGIWRDWAADSAYWKQFEGPVQETATKINDSFLQANRQEGVVSYSRVTELLVEYYHEYVLKGVTP